MKTVIIGIVLAIACFAAAAAIPHPAIAAPGAVVERPVVEVVVDECVDIFEDKAKVQAQGFEWLGTFDTPMPSYGGGAAFYSRDGIVFLSPIFDGCVGDDMYGVGRLVAPEPVAPAEAEPVDPAPEIAGPSSPADDMRNDLNRIKGGAPGKNSHAPPG